MSPSLTQRLFVPLGAEPPFCVFKGAGGATLHADATKNFYMKDDTVDFETHMTASRSRHCVRARMLPSPQLLVTVSLTAFGCDYRSARR